jgi:hypothetical protein
MGVGEASAELSAGPIALALASTGGVDGSFLTAKRALP